MLSLKQIKIKPILIKGGINYKFQNAKVIKIFGDFNVNQAVQKKNKVEIT